MGDITEVFNRFWKKPFDPNGDAVNWILFLGFLMIVALGWSRVISKVTTD